jgi:NTE family protein
MSMAGKLALVLSGGGARGAYEVGVLSWLAENRPEFFDQVRIVTGSSVGAINAAYLASRGMRVEAVAGLEELWLSLRFGTLLEFSSRRIIRSLLARTGRFISEGGNQLLGLLDTQGYQDLIRNAVDWDGFEKTLSEGRLDAIAIGVTAVNSGQTHMFFHHNDNVETPTWPNDGSIVPWKTQLQPEHILASASLPFLFPPIQIGNHWYCDGGLRQNTPLSPALRLGADKIFAISLKKVPKPGYEAPDDFPGFGKLLGKLFNSIFLDRLLWDLDRLNRTNVLLDCVEEIAGDDALERLREALIKRGRRPDNRVKYVRLRPSEDIGELAGKMLDAPHELNSDMGFILRRILGGGRSRASDAASYLLFDGAFARVLMDLGRQDTASSADMIDTLLSDGAK